MSIPSITNSTHQSTAEKVIEKEREMKEELIAMILANIEKQTAIIAHDLTSSNGSSGSSTSHAGVLDSSNAIKA